MSNKVSAIIGATLCLYMIMQVPELSFLVIPALIIGAVCVLKGEKKDWSEQSVKDYGVDLSKPREKWTAADEANYKAKQREKASKKGYDLMQMTRRYAHEQLKLLLAENEIYDMKDAPPEIISRWIRTHSNTLPTVEAFQEYANTLPSNLASELMSAVKHEAKCAGVECGSRNGGTDGWAIDKVQAMKKDAEAKKRLFAVIDKCDDYLANISISKNVTEKKIGSPEKSDYSQYHF